MGDIVELLQEAQEQKRILKMYLIHLNLYLLIFLRNQIIWIQIKHK